MSTKFQSDEQRQPVWYVMDEFGSQIWHNDVTTNVCVVPFVDMALTGQAYSLMFPCSPIEANSWLTKQDKVKWVYEKCVVLESMGIRVRLKCPK